MERVYPGCCLSRKLCNEVSKEGGRADPDTNWQEQASKGRWEVDGILRSLTERDEWRLLWGKRKQTLTDFDRVNRFMVKIEFKNAVVDQFVRSCSSQVLDQNYISTH